MKHLMDTGLSPVPPGRALHQRLAFLSLVAVCSPSAVAVNVDRAISTRAVPFENLRKSAAGAESLVPVVRKEHPFQPFGTPRYPDEHPDLTWNDLSGHTRGMLG